MQTFRENCSLHLICEGSKAGIMLGATILWMITESHCSEGGLHLLLKESPFNAPLGS